MPPQFPIAFSRIEDIALSLSRYYLATETPLCSIDGMENRMFDLTGKVALVTGGGRGIGLALARGLAGQGADVALVARSAEQLDAACKRIGAETGRRAWAFPFDVADVSGIGGLFERIVKTAGGVDVLVNAAGTTVRQPSEEASLDDFRRTMEVNLTAAMAMSQAFCRHCKSEGKPGRIINIGSLMCHAARPTVAGYACSKAALLALTRTLSVEWAKYGINVNAIGPGYIRTDLTASLEADAEFDRWVLSKTPLGRWGDPEDLVGTAVLLASKAGQFITGQIFYVDGGWTALL
jgi:gluconate 5-dehydrogenase